MFFNFLIIRMKRFPGVSTKSSLEADAVKRVKSYNFNNADMPSEDQKLLRNRESARNSRKRKKIYIEMLENKLTELNEELEQTKSLVFENQKNLQDMCVQI